MDAIRTACVRHDLGVPSAVKYLTAFIMLLIDKAGWCRLAENDVKDLTAAYKAKSVTIPILEPEVVGQKASLVARVDAGRAVTQDSCDSLE